MSLSLGLGLLAKGRTRFTPASLFAASDTGAWYDPSDLSSMFQDVNGQTAPAVGSPVGLLLDKKRGLALGTDRLTYGDFRDGHDWAVPLETTISGGKLNFNAVTTVRSVNSGGSTGSMTAGKLYRIKFDIDSISGGSVRLALGGNVTNTFTTAGAKTVYLFAGSTTNTFTIQGITGVTAQIDNVVVQEVRGDHASQSTAAARPILRQDAGGKYYLEFDGVDDWLRASFTIAQPWDRVSAIRQITWTDNEIVFHGVGTGAGGALYQTGASPSLSLHSGTAACANAGAAVGANVVATERHNGAGGRLGINSGAYSTGNVGTSAAAGITIGANELGTGGFSNVRLYGTTMIGRALTDAETTQLRSYMAEKSAVTL